MDGVGITDVTEGNALHEAKTPHLDRLFKSDLYTELKAHGTAVGLPSDGDMGNSEVGHNALGAGRVISQGATLVNEAIESRNMYASDTWKKIAGIGKNGHTVHFLGLLSDGNVHSHIDHLLDMLKQCATEGIKRVRVHMLADGRDVLDRSAITYTSQLEVFLGELNAEKNVDYRIASGGGRMKVTMDRYNADWNIVKTGWYAHVLGEGRLFPSASDAITTFYSEDKTISDQYLDPFVVTDEAGNPNGTIQDGDGVIFFNFRGDRAIEISQAFEQETFEHFDRVRIPDVFYCGMMQYDGDLQIPKQYLVSPPMIDKTLSEYLCEEKVPSFAISETQKYGHVTYFWNGNKSDYISESLETYIEIPSDRIEFDKAPKMKAQEITDKTIDLLNSGKYRFGRLNFANGDMVGHTGNMEAAIDAMEAVDNCVGQLLEAIDALDGIAIITADHGNVEDMFSIKNGEKIPKTSHTLNPVPFIINDPLYNNEYSVKTDLQGGLTHIAATVCNLLGYEKPAGYDESIIRINSGARK